MNKDLRKVMLFFFWKSPWICRRFYYHLAIYNPQTQILRECDRLLVTHSHAQSTYLNWPVLMERMGFFWTTLNHEEKWHKHTKGKMFNIKFDLFRLFRTIQYGIPCVWCCLYIISSIFFIRQRPTGANQSSHQIHTHFITVITKFLAFEICLFGTFWWVAMQCGSKNKTT